MPLIALQPQQHDHEGPLAHLFHLPGHGQGHGKGHGHHGEHAGRHVSPGPSRYPSVGPQAVGNAENGGTDRGRGRSTSPAPRVEYEYPVLLSESQYIKQQEMLQKQRPRKQGQPKQRKDPSQERSSATYVLKQAGDEQKSKDPPPLAPAPTPAVAEAPQAPMVAVPPAAATALTLSEQVSDMEMDTLLAQKGFTISRHRVYNAGLPAGVLGKGNFGAVYKATGHGAPWAVKKIESASAFEFLTQKEIEVLRLLNGHPNIVALKDTVVYPPRDWMFIVMEFVEGGDLLGALTRYPHIFDEPLVRAMLFQLSCGLGCAHEAGVLHRDLKPENILLRRDMVPKIADFGLSRIVGRTEVCQTMAGTPGYMAPEIMDVRVPYDFPADMYSFGLIVFDMLSDKSCCEWCMANKPASDKERFLKRWPDGARPTKKSADIIKLQKKAISQVPGERITAHQMCQELLELAETDPMPCKLWSAETKRPTKAPAQRMVSPVDAAEIAGRLGYTKGQPVMIFAEGEVRKGKVEHISTALCPGAAQVRYKIKGEEKTTLICPWQFADVLRPALREPLSGERSIITKAGDDSEAVVAKATRRPVPEVQKSRCRPATCSVQ